VSSGNDTLLESVSCCYFDIFCWNMLIAVTIRLCKDIVNDI
jgi:hypothetical protein